MANKESKYGQLGVESDKSGIGRLFARGTRNDFPGTFCNVVRMKEFFGYVCAMHPDGVGSLSLTRWIAYLVTGDSRFLRGDFDNALVMNVGDVSAAGFVDEKRPYYLTDTIGINKNAVDKPLYLQELCNRAEELLPLYLDYGFEIIWTSGETGDLPHQVRSSVLDMNVFATIAEDRLILGNVQPGDKHFGFSSGGRAVWEDEENSGVMSNGATGYRTFMLHPCYNDMFPEICPELPRYTGRFKIGDYIKELGMTIEQALTARTRHFPFIIKMIIDELDKIGARHLLHGISMNTGGGCTKVGKLGKGIIYEKQMPKTLPFFELYQSETGETTENMLRDTNYGIGLDVVGSDEGGILTSVLQLVSDKTGVLVHPLGECSRYGVKDQNFVVVKVEGDNEFYDYPIKLDH